MLRAAGKETNQPDRAPRHAKRFTALLPANKKTAPPLIFKKLRIFCNIYRFGIKT